MKTVRTPQCIDDLITAVATQGRADKHLTEGTRVLLESALRFAGLPAGGMVAVHA
jgi:hypothetical protein